jgi:hypothetical protein
MSSSKEVFSLAFLTDSKINRNIDLKDILHVLGDDFVSSLTWGITNLEWYGNEIEDFLDKEKNAQDGMILISGKEFLETANKIYQTVDGLFIGYLNEKSAKEFLAKKWAYSGYFEKSSAQVKIEIKQNWAITVEVRSKKQAELIINSFENVQIENAVKLA